MPSRTPNPFLKNLQETPSSRWAARRRSWWLAAGVCALLLAIAALVHSALKESLEDLLSASLSAVVKAEAADLKAWIEEELHDLRTLADSEAVRQEISNLLGSAARDEDAPTESEKVSDRHAIRDYFADSHRERDRVGFFVSDRSGRILAADDRSLEGEYIAHEGATVLAQVFEKGAGFYPPLRPESLFGNRGAGRVPVALVLGSVIPTPSTQTKVGLFLLIDPRGEFSALFQDSGVGRTGHTFAFDSTGKLVTRTRHEDLFRRLGSIPSDSDETAVLNIRVTDPGVDLTRAQKNGTSPSEQLLTRMAANAVSGSSGMDVEGYRDYRGVQVLGAWRWLPDYRLGIATEIERREALRLLRPVRIALYSLIGLFVVAGAVIVQNSSSALRLRREIRQIRFLGQYELEEKIGEGGMGVVYKARHALLQRPTAVKLLKSDDLSDDSVARFEREVQLTSQLNHPNTIEIYDFGRTEEGVFYYVMEYLEGLDLQELVRLEGKLPIARAIHFLKQILASLREAHERGLVHRDIKPTNIIVCERGGVEDFIKVLDFGLARGLGAGDSAYRTSSAILTGTPLYLAPERMTDPDSIDPRSDLYAVGVVAFHLLTGKYPFDFSSDYEIFHHIANTPPRPPSAATEIAIPEKLDAAVFDCLQKKPEDRPQSARKLLALLEAVSVENPWTEEDARVWWKRYRKARESNPEDLDGQVSPDGDRPQALTRAVGD